MSCATRGIRAWSLTEWNPQPCCEAKNTMKESLTKREVADLNRVSVRTIEGWMKRGYLPYFKIGGVVRFPVAQLESAMNRFLINRRTCRAESTEAEK